MQTDFQQWMSQTFVRDDRVALTDCPDLVVQRIDHPVRLTFSQTHQLIVFLRQRFCHNCGGTGLDEDGLNGKCEFCNTFPF